MFETSFHTDGEVRDIETAHKVIKALEKYYPFHDWFVSSNSSGGYLTIQLMYEDERRIRKVWRYGMLKHLANLGSEAEIDACAKGYGGELLERYGLARQTATIYTRHDGIRNVDTSGMIQ